MLRRPEEISPGLRLKKLMAPMLLGQVCHRVEGLWDEMYREAILHGRTGTVMRAISIVDIALRD